MKPTITRILCATDLSTHSAYTMTHAASLAAATGARLHMVHAVQPMSDDAKITMQIFLHASGASDTAAKARHDHAKAVMAEKQRQFWAMVDEENPEVRKQIDTIDLVDGYPAEVILRRSRELNCDLIVIGAHEHGYSQTFLGTVAKRVLRRAPIPTLVVPYRDDAAAG